MLILFVGSRFPKFGPEARLAASVSHHESTEGYMATACFPQHRQPKIDATWFQDTLGTAIPTKPRIKLAGAQQRMRE